MFLVSESTNYVSGVAWEFSRVTGRINFMKVKKVLEVKMPQRWDNAGAV